MNVLQYCFSLDPGADMNTIRDRVASKRRLLNSLPGLRWKAWLLAEPVPQFDQPKSYAPVYLFEDELATLAFLKSDIYKGVTDAFGWTSPLVGPAVTVSANGRPSKGFCTVRTDLLPSHRALTELLAVPQPDGDTSSVVRQIDIARMRLRTYSFWRTLAEAARQLETAPVENLYEVVAVSGPGQVDG